MKKRVSVFIGRARNKGEDGDVLRPLTPSPEQPLPRRGRRASISRRFSLTSLSPRPSQADKGLVCPSKTNSQHCEDDNEAHLSTPRTQGAESTCQDLTYCSTPRTASLPAQPRTITRHKSMSLSPNALRAKMKIGADRRRSEINLSQHTKTGIGDLDADMPTLVPENYPRRRRSLRRRVSKSLSLSPGALRAKIGAPPQQRRSDPKEIYGSTATNLKPSLSVEPMPAHSKWLATRGRPGFIRAATTHPVRKPSQLDDPEPARAICEPPDLPVRGSPPSTGPGSRQQRGSLSISPKNLRVVTRLGDQGGALASAAAKAIESRGLSASGMFGSTHTGVSGTGFEPPKLKERGRSLSLAFTGRPSFSLSPPSSPSSSLSIRAGGNRSPGFRQRLRRRAGGDGGDKAKSVSPSGGRRRDRRRSITMGYGAFSMNPALMIVEGGLSGCLGEEHGGLPSVLDAVPEWRQQDVLRSLEERTAKFTTVHGVEIFCGTWNVNAKKPDLANSRWLDEWLCPIDKEDGKKKPGKDGRGGGRDKMNAKGKDECGQDGVQTGSENRDGMSDLYAIGLQEVVDLNAVNVAIDTRSQKRSTEWEERVSITLNLAAQKATKTESAQSSPPSIRRAAKTCSTSRGSPALRDGPENLGGGRTSVSDDNIRNQANDSEKQAVVAGSAAVETPVYHRRGSTASTFLSLGAGGRSYGALSGNDDDRPTEDDDARQSFASGGGTAASGKRDEKEKGKAGLEQQKSQRPEQGGRAAFVLVAKEHLVGTWVAVFVRASLLPMVSDVRCGTVSAGMMGVMGNKGGVGIRLRLRSSSLCFVCSHLAAHRDNVRARNENYVKILREMTFRPPAAGEFRAQQQQRQQTRDSSPGSPGFRRRFSAVSASQADRPSRSPVPALLSTLGRAESRSPSPPDSPGRRGGAGMAQLKPPHQHNPHNTERNTMVSQRRASFVTRRVRRSISFSSFSGFSKTTPAGAEAILQGERGASPVENMPPLLPCPTTTTLTAAKMCPVAALSAIPGAHSASTSDIKGLAGNSELGSLSASSSADRARRLGSTYGATDMHSECRSVEESERISVGLALSDDNDEATTLIARSSPVEERDLGSAGVGVDLSLKIHPTGGDAVVASGGGKGPGSGGNVASDSWEKATDGDGPTRPAGTMARVFKSGGVGSSRSGEEVMGEGLVRTTKVLSMPAIGARDSEERLGIQDHDAVFWLGDLNYRIDSSVAALDVLHHALSRQLAFLAENDQLNRAREAGDAFEGFHEGIDHHLCSLCTWGVDNHGHSEVIDFLPTYKYTAGTDEYDVRTDKKFRAPAWCDRILYWTARGGNPTMSAGEAEAGAGEVTQLGYRRSETPLISDHKPVSASYRFGCRQVDHGKCRKILMELIDAVPKGAANGQPQVDIVEGGAAIDFGNVHYGERESRCTWIENNGRVAARFTTHSANRLLAGFPTPSPSNSDADRCSKPGEQVGTDMGLARNEECSESGAGAVVGRKVNSPTKSGDTTGSNGGDDDTGFAEKQSPAQQLAIKWYTVIPGHATLQPGERVEIKFRLKIKDPAARELASARVSSKLEDVLVLKVDQGEDRQISVAAQYTPSVYGSSLEAMARTTSSTPRDGDRSEPLAMTGNSNDLVHNSDCRGGEGVVGDATDAAEETSTQTPVVPHQIERMIDDLLRDGCCLEPGLFVEDGVEEEVRVIRDAINSGASFGPHSAHSMVEALVTLLESLSPSTIPESACLAESETLESLNIAASARAFLGEIAPLHRAVFVRLVRFFRHLLVYGKHNGLTMDQVVFVQRSCLLPDAWRPKAYSRVRQARGSPSEYEGHGTTRESRVWGERIAPEDVHDDSKAHDVLDLVLRYLLLNEP